MIILQKRKDVPTYLTIAVPLISIAGDTDYGRADFCIAWLSAFSGVV